MRTVDQARREVLLSAERPGLETTSGQGLAPEPGLGENNEVSLSEPLSLTDAYGRLSLLVASTISLGDVLGDKNRATYGEVMSRVGDGSSTGENRRQLPQVRSHGQLMDHNTRGQSSKTNGEGDSTSGGKSSGSGGRNGGGGGGARRDHTVGYRCCDVLASVKQVCIRE